MSLASSIVNKCLSITAKDNVTVFLYPHSLPLAEDVAHECFRKGADVLFNLYTDKYMLSYMTQLSLESLRQPSVFCKALAENSTAEIWMGGMYNPRLLRNIAPERNAASGEGEAKAHWPLTKERKVRTLGVGLSMVTEPRAKTYGFSYSKWRKMMYEACDVNYAKLAETGRRLRDRLRDSNTIHVTGPEGTDLTFDTSGRKWLISDGVVSEEDIAEENFGDEIPAGNIRVVPLEESANGKVAFNVMTPYAGRNVESMAWTFRDGRVVEFTGDVTARKVKQSWRESTGDKDRIAYFAIGFNPKAKTGYTVSHVASGAVSFGIGGNPLFGGRNDSGFFFLDTLTGASVEADGKAIMKDGVLPKEFTATS